MTIMPRSGAYLRETSQAAKSPVISVLEVGYRETRHLGNRRSILLSYGTLTRSCRYGRDRGGHNERSALRHLAGLIGLLRVRFQWRNIAIAPFEGCTLHWGMPGRYYRLALDCPGQVVSIASAGLAVILRFAQWW